MLRVILRMLDSTNPRILLLMYFMNHVVLEDYWSTHLLLTMPVMHLIRVNSIRENDDPAIQTITNNSILNCHLLDSI